MNHIMMVGAGDLGLRVAASLMLREKIDALTLVDLPSGGGPKAAEYMRCCNKSPIYFEGINCLDTGAVDVAKKLIKDNDDTILVLFYWNAQSFLYMREVFKSRYMCLRGIIQHLQTGLLSDNT